MADNRKKIQNLLENVIRASKILMEKGYLDAVEGEQNIRCLMGIRQRFLSKEYMSKSPTGQEIDEIDEMILPLDRMLVEAGKKGYRNTISYILKAVVQGAGVGHRILTAEEEKNKALVLLQRKLKVSEHLENIEEAQKLDEKIGSRKFVMKRQQMLRRDCQNYEKKIEQMQKERPDIMDEILFFTDIEDMSQDALAYIDLTSSLEKAKRDISEQEEDLDNLEFLIQSYMQVLDQAKRWDMVPGEDKVSRQDKKAQTSVSETSISEQTADSSACDLGHHTEESENQTFDITKISDESAFQTEDDLISEKKIQEMQKLIEKFVDEDSPDMIDLGYKAMERIFASRELNEYAADSWRDFEELGLAKEDVEI